MKKIFTLIAATLMAAGAYAQTPTPVYFNDFSSTDGLTIVGNGVFEDDENPAFGKIFHNDPTLTKAMRTNYLLLPADVLSHSATSKEMTIGCWVNMKSAADFFFSPLFAAYGAAPVNGENTWPMFVCEARGLLQLNCAGYCDFGINDSSAGTSFNDGTPYVTTAWLDDAAWHYYTVVLTTTTAKVYVDGELKNGWTLDGTSGGQVIAGLFTNGADLKYICLGGNQAWAWGDPDPAFGFDDFAVYDVALSADQIKQIVNKKNALSAVARCKAWETSSEFATAIDAVEFTTPEEAFAFHTKWQVENGSVAKAIINNDVTSADRWWGDLTNGANYDGAPDNNYLSYNTNENPYNVNQIVYGLPAGSYEVSAWTYSSTEAVRNLYVDAASTWTSLLNSAPQTTAQGWQKLTAEFTLTETTNVGFGFYAPQATGRIAGFDNWQLKKVTTGINEIDTEAEAQKAQLYNLAGQRVDKNFKGIVIANGKKMLKK